MRSSKKLEKVGEAEILPEDKDARPSINVILQYINETNTFPDASTLSKYSPDDKEWIKQRTEVEQRFRHTITESLIEKEHKETLHLQTSIVWMRNFAAAIGFLFSVLVLALTVVLLMLDQKWEAFIFLSVCLGIPITGPLLKFISSKN